MKKARYRVVVGDVTARALVISQLKSSSAHLVAVIASESGDVKRVNEPAHRNIAVVPEPNAAGGDRFSPLLVPTGSVVVRYQNVCHDQNAACLRRKRGRSRIARLCAR
jgi:hypothetical protein